MTDMARVLHLGRPLLDAHPVQDLAQSARLANWRWLSCLYLVIRSAAVIL
ncbi:hypothetical protein HUO07_15080 [Halomonas sp. QX-1]|uniref:Uncharacterized protein n=1 Tax=Vreelandella maris TaxID=2729617 RepID=A0A7Y6REI6_9GAMM|nr:MULTISPECIES: hypothetical protein [Halomonas]NVF15490.1 hypothetical protein [Halomonas maris]|tara:strand:- start:58495 stop:58644 length:150 start_codon:yes stop_codon:yes gene_type:complete